MEVRLRLRKAGKSAKGAYNFRIVACSREQSRDSRFLDDLGYYDPSKRPVALKIDRARVDYWLQRGATPTDTVRNLLKKGASEK